MFSLFLVAEEDPYFTNDDLLPYLYLGYVLMAEAEPSPTAWLGMYSLYMAGGRCEVMPDPPVDRALFFETSCGMSNVIAACDEGIGQDANAWWCECWETGDFLSPYCQPLTQTDTRPAPLQDVCDAR